MTNDFTLGVRYAFRSVLCAGGLFLLMLGSAPVSAREADGTLGLIRRPNNGMPALVTPGGSFEAVLLGEAELRLVQGDREWPLAPSWTALPGGRHAATCAVPADVPPGPCVLRAAAGGATDENARAVWVFAEFPKEYYVVAHVSDTHIGKERYERSSDDINRDLFAEVNRSDAAFVAVTGDLTESGTPDQFRRFLAVLDTAALPSFVCAGNHDRDADAYERFFDTSTYMFTFGRDGYLVYDTREYLVADDEGPQNGLLHRFRRALKPSRWTVGLTHRHEDGMGMRAQLLLYVDEPLDFLLQGHTHTENDPGQRVPWGTTAQYIVPAAIDGHLRLLDVTEQGVIPRAVARPVETGARRDGRQGPPR